ncbi:hypothetical protein MDUV_42450 [Mycolicibacterium duvalii]|uniref:PE-PPE domain-containing protein n=1 Tax=Mycolicibacterium duvalii TaxID=39688 RepID=A0A7I7K5M3_9MYCO|nr:hypothetical protein MDUV_42450 [Mycolicibacterium duvalii]
MPAALGLTQQPAAEAATVLGVEGTLQPPRTTVKSFQNAFCEENTCRTVNFSPGLGDSWSGAWSLQAAVTMTPGDLILMGYSSGAGSIHDRLRVWHQMPSLGPDPDRVVLIVTMGNPENKYGGQARHYWGTGFPDDNPYKTLNVTMQYDAVADRPDRFGFWSQINLSFINHFAYRNIDINDPNNLVYYDEEDGVTYMLVKAEVLPMLQWVDPFASDEQMATLDAIFRPLVEQDYDRPAYVEQGEGADWGNGLPPASLQGSDRQEERRAAGEDDSDATPTAEDAVTDDGEPTASPDEVGERVIETVSTDQLDDAPVDEEPVDEEPVEPEEVDLDALTEDALAEEQAAEEAAEETDSSTVTEAAEVTEATTEAGGGSDDGADSGSENRRSERASTAA